MCFAVHRAVSPPSDGVSCNAREDRRRSTNLALENSLGSGERLEIVRVIGSHTFKTDQKTPIFVFDEWRAWERNDFNEELHLFW